MAQRQTTILQDFVEIRCSHKGPVRWQRWQRLLAPVEPLLQCRGNGETAPQGLLKRIGCGQGKIPPRPAPFQRPRGLIRRNWDWVTASKGLTTRIRPAGERSRQQVNVGFGGTNRPPQTITLVNPDQRASIEIKIHITG